MHCPSVGFAYAHSLRAERLLQAGPGREDVPALEVVYYATAKLGRRKGRKYARCHHRGHATCVHAKQGSISVGRTSLTTVQVDVGETGEEATPPSPCTSVWGASLVLKPAQLLIRG